ncbi:MAG: sugar transferase [Candidatus Saccharibacteria bacterium]|nr:sugar transferase [Candidatus Saccharibacteria bacterium]
MDEERIAISADRILYVRATAGLYQQKIKKLSYTIIKRGFDIIFGTAGCLLLLPLSAGVKAAYLLSGDTAPIFYKHKRIGKDGKVFDLYKFRSMVPNADAMLAELLANDETLSDEWDKYQKLDNDPRITKVGKLLRKLSLDELPQVLNIMRNDMSLIGPRPLTIGELDEHKGNHNIYESVKPGISGWWAANGRSDVSFHERLQLEYYYANNASVVLDAKCIWLTIITVLSSKGAK